MNLLTDFRYRLNCGDEPTLENVHVETDPPMWMDEIPAYIIGRIRIATREEAESRKQEVLNKWLERTLA